MTSDWTSAAPRQAGTAWPALGDAERAALRVVLTRGPLPRAEIARALGLSRASLTRVTRNLMEHGLIVEGGVQLRGWTGRPSELLRVRPDARHLFGVKLTGDTAFTVVTDLAGQIVDVAQETLAARDVATVVAQIGDAHDRAAATFGDIAGAGVCIAGDIAALGGRELVIDSAYLGWNEVPLRDLLVSRLGIPVRVENDVRALTAAEHLFGAGAGADPFALVTVGVGIGFAFTIGGRVIGGHTGHAARVDHIIVDPSGPICGLGHRGCASAYLPSSAIAESLRVPELDYDGAVALARDGHPGALLAFRQAGRALGVVLGTVANFVDPERIVLTGDGLAVVEFAEREIDEAIRDVRVPRGASTPLTVRAFAFSHWARAGAITGLLALLDGAS